MKCIKHLVPIRTMVYEQGPFGSRPAGSIGYGASLRYDDLIDVVTYVTDLYSEDPGAAAIAAAIAAYAESEGLYCDRYVQRYMVARCQQTFEEQEEE